MWRADFFAQLKIQETHFPICINAIAHKHEHDSSPELEIIVSKFDFRIWQQQTSFVTLTINELWTLRPLSDATATDKNEIFASNERVNARIHIDWIRNRFAHHLHWMWSRDELQPIGFACKWHFALKWLCLGHVGAIQRLLTHRAFRKFKVHFCMQISTLTAFSVCIAPISRLNAKHFLFTEWRFSFFLSNLSVSVSIRLRATPFFVSDPIPFFLWTWCARSGWDCLIWCFNLSWIIWNELRCCLLCAPM